jgi:hypothetical protein
MLILLVLAAPVVVGLEQLQLRQEQREPQTQEAVAVARVIKEGRVEELVR